MKKLLINIEDLRINQAYEEKNIERKRLNYIPIGRPDSKVYVRFHPNDEYYLTAPVLEDGERKEVYLVDPKLNCLIEKDLKRKMLAVGITNAKNLFVWPVALGTHRYSQSAQEIMILGKNSWCRIRTDLEKACYEPVFPEGQIPEPKWPDLTLTEIVNIAFKDNYIDSEDHPVILRLLGKAGIK